MSDTDIDYIEDELRLTRRSTAPWPPLSGHILNAYTRLEALRTGTPPPPPPVSGPPVPVGAVIFEDDFNGTAIDTHKWEGKHYTAPSGTQWDYLNYAAVDGNDNLVITATKGSATGQWYSTFMAALASNGFAVKGPFYAEARAKVPAGAGTFPAPIWFWASPWGSGPFELDVCEQLGKEQTKYHTTVHPWLPSGDKPVELPGGYDTKLNLSADFHRYGAALYSSHVDFYFDGAKVWTADMSQSGLGDLTQYPLVPCIDLDMGGWGGTIDPALTQASMLVDYIRVWRLA